MTPRPIVIDCDPGVDDAVALLCAFASPEELEVAAVTTVAGNAPLATTAANARRIRSLAGRDEVPVFAGCPRPLLRPLRTAEHVHGETGLGGVELPPAVAPLAGGHAVAALIDLVDARPGELTLCPTGPLTNVAAAFAMRPDIAGKIREIVLMGGAVGAGNVTASAEFNVHADPHAAAIVFAAGAKLTMLGLDVTQQALTTPERLAAIGAIDRPAARCAARMLAHYHRVDIPRYGAPGAPLHDACVIGYLLRPDLFAGRDAFVAVETASELTMGRTAVDLWDASGAPPNAHVVQSIDADGFFALLTGRLARL